MQESRSHDTCCMSHDTYGMSHDTCMSHDTYGSLQDCESDDFEFLDSQLLLFGKMCKVSDPHTHSMAAHASNLLCSARVDHTHLCSSPGQQ